MPDLSGDIAIISGGARGIGASTARALAKAGARVVIGDVLEDEGRSVVADIGGAATFVRLDVTSPDSWTTAVDVAERVGGRLSVLVNNAGIFVPGSIHDTTPADVRRAFEVNQLGVFLGMQALIGPMRRAGRGSIVNVSSSAGVVGVPAAIAYSSSKWAVRGLTRGAALDLAPDGIRVNSVHPGLVETPIFSGFPREALGQMTGGLPIPRMGRPEEIAALICFLASEDASFCTGAEYLADGGYATA